MRAKLATPCVIGLALIFNTAQAETKFCDDAKIRTFSVEGQREEPTPFGNKLVITLNDLKGQPMRCGNAEFLYLENTDPSYIGILSTALAANLVGKVVKAGVSQSKDAPKKGAPTMAKLVFLGL